MRLSAQMPLNEARLLFLDVETTGLSPARGDRIVEIGLIACVGSRERARWRTLVHPQQPIPSQARAVHGIGDDEVATSPPFAAVAETVRRAIHGVWVVGHHVRFDIGFIAAELACCGVQVTPAGCLDTCQLAAGTWDLPDYKLPSLVRHLDLPATGPAHRALADADFARGVFARVVREAGGWDALTVADLQARHRRMPAWPQDAAGQLPPRLQDGLTHRREVAIRYLNGLGDVTRRSIRPLACYAVGGRVYIRAYCSRAREQRTFRLDRISFD
jgi:DNA polymerase III epsilon subunit-like protein